MTTTVINFRDLPKVMATSARGIKRAGSNTLNDVAFKALPELVKQAESDMKFSKNARRALGWQIEKSNIATMQATIHTRRGWFALHSDDGRRQSSHQGMTWKGQSWIFVPRSKGEGAVDKLGRIRKSAANGIYLTPRGDYALVFYRQRRNKKETDFIGVAVKSAKFNMDTDWQKVIKATWMESANTIFRRNIAKRAAFEASK